MFTGDTDSASAVQNGSVDSDSMPTTSHSWCRISYHRYRDLVGSPGCLLPVYADSVHVFSGLHQGAEGLCLSAVRSAADDILLRV